MNVKRNRKDNLDKTLRPKRWEDYIGQKKIKENVKIIIEAAQQRKESPEHLLFYGNAGLGKTTLAHLIAQKMGSNIKITSGPAIEKPGDLAAILTNLNEGDILFIDEIHRLNKICEEIIYPGLEEFKLNLIIGKGPMAKTLDLDLPRFTLIGATTRIAKLTSPLRSRFGAIFHLNFYKPKEIQEILRRSAKILNLEIDEESLEIISQRSRFTPRIANRLLKRIRDFAQVKNKGHVNREITLEALNSLEIDGLGLDPSDKKIIEAIITKFEGGPVGLQTLAASLSEEVDNIVEIYEPYLLQSGLIKRTPKGRLATEKAYKHLNLKKNKLL